ncbi:MAG: hypothetical protein Q4G19_04340 [Clostridia bacterium]|nr:hypothetical protein [Clostridia bacterium]
MRKILACLLIVVQLVVMLSFGSAENGSDTVYGMNGTAAEQNSAAGTDPVAGGGSTAKITAQPQDAYAAKAGDSALTEVVATGDGLTYTWYYKDKGDSSFTKGTATGSTYKLTMTAAKNGRQVYCVVKDQYGNKVKSSTATLGIRAKITTQPKNAAAESGVTVTAKIVATGDGLEYTWYYKDPGAESFTQASNKTATYSTTMTASRDGRKVYCVVKDEYGNKVKSNTVTLRIAATLKITTQPQSMKVAKVGDSITTKIAATGDGLTYAWYYKDPGESSFTKGSTRIATYSIVITDIRDGRKVYCIVTDQYGNSVKSNTVTFSVAVPVKITTQPKNAAADSGETVTTKITATGDGLKYAWYYKDPGSSSFTKASNTTATYSTTMTASRDGRQVYCIVEDQYGYSAKSNTVTLRIAPKITTQPKNVNAAKAGDSVMTEVVATGDGLTYAWYYKDKGDSSFTKGTATTAAYKLTMTAEKNGRQIYCVVKDKYGSTVKSKTVTLGICAQITRQPKSAAAASGETVTAKIVVSGDGLKYAWYCKDPGASSFTKTSNTTATYSITMTASRDGRKVYCIVEDAYGNSVKSDTVTLSIAVTAKITAQPKNVKVAKAGDTATVKITAVGDGLTYTWYYKDKGSSSFTKASNTAASYSIKMTDDRDGRKVYCVIKDKYGNSVTSNTVTLSIAVPVQITTQPKNVKAVSGATVATKVVATGDGLTYVWYYKDPSATSFTKTSNTTASYSMTMTASRDGRKVYCIVKDVYGNSVRSNTVTLSLAPPVKITTQPADVTVPVGTNAAFTVAATGDGLQYQWQFTNETYETWTNSNATGNQTATLTLPGTLARNGNRYRCVITDKYGQSAISRTVTLTVYTPAKITTQPTDAAAESGATVTTKVTATGDGLTYVWYCKDPGATSFTKTSNTTATYSVTMTASRNGRKVYCIVKDKYGTSVKSNTVTLSLTAPVRITTQPKDVTVAESGDTATVKVVAAGDGLTYVWYYKDPGSSSFSKTSNTTATYSVMMSASRDGRKVYCVVTDKYGNSVKSNTVTLSIAVALKITTQPKDVKASKAGDEVTVKVAATGAGLKYVWYYKDRGDTSFTKTSVTTASYSVTMKQSMNGRLVYCVVTDQYGNTAQSQTAVLSIATPATILVQPSNVRVAAAGSTASTTIVAMGDGLTYAWYYKDKDSGSFTKGTETTATYSITMTADNNGRQIYCVVTDKYGNTARSDTVMLSYIAP